MKIIITLAVLSLSAVAVYYYVRSIPKVIEVPAESIPASQSSSNKSSEILVQVASAGIYVDKEFIEKEELDKVLSAGVARGCRKAALAWDRSADPKILENIQSRMRRLGYSEIRMIGTPESFYDRK